MTKALIKKQMMEVFSWVFYNRKSAKRRNGRQIFFYGLLYLLIFGIVGFFFWEIAELLCTPLSKAGYAWLYLALMGLMAVAFGVFGSVFNTYSTLYCSKDNDLLLSMPIPASRLLFVRLFGVWAMGFLYELIILLPAILVYFLCATPNIAAVCFCTLLPLILSFFVLTLSCVLGYAVALVSARLKNKNAITVILSLAFIAAYYYFYMKAYDMLQSIVENPSLMGGKIKSIFYPFYWMGRAGEGALLSMLLFTAFVALLLGITYLLLTHSFLRLATANHGVSKAKYREKPIRIKSVPAALLQKEMRRFLGSPTYMLNCGLGILLLVIAAIVLLFKRSDLLALGDFSFSDQGGLLSLVTAAVVCALSSTIDITAPSVSLEGSNLPILQSLPVSAAQVLIAKLKLHLYLAILPSVFLTIAALTVLRPAWHFWLLTPLAVTAFVLCMALIGLLLNLKMPNLQWANEAVPVKQGASIVCSLFGGWAFILVFGILYGVVRTFCTPALYLLLVIVVLLTLSLLLFRWITTRGAEIFESL